MESIWMKDYYDKNLPSIKKDVNTPILIIGGGLAGLMCAYNFMKNNIDFILVDSKKLASGVSANTTAQITYAHTNLYDDIIKKHGKEKVNRYLESQIEGFNIMQNIIKEETIDCDYKEESTIIGAYLQKNIKILDNLQNTLNKYNLSKVTNANNIIFNKKDIEIENQFIINPIKYMMGIIDILIDNNCKLYENSKVTKINKNNNNYEVIINNKYKINTNKIIMTCHYPIINPDNLYFTKIFQSKSYAVAFKSKLKLDANYLSLDEPYYYFRTYDDNTLIIGGSDHYTGINNDINKCYDDLISKIYRIDKDAKIVSKWFTEDCMPIDSLPYVGVYSNNHKNIILVTGFQKWGFTNSHIAAKNVTNMLFNKIYDDLYKTHRYTLFRDLKSTFRMIAHSIDGLILSKLFIKKEDLNNIKIGSGKVIRSNNKNILVYRESKDKYVFLKNKCTHLGCSLIWNDVDKVWESKCHGSIFDKYGKVIYGPAINDLEELF
ncbi:MAG: FAD-dependent oxidoreductase [Bacilli bacterium]|nr:FAD-dependent oxidoreductase [Bacilli bacterium]MDD4406810.1 FAD-dependent oxidoreductase [Bacilli bacterium]